MLRQYSAIPIVVLLSASAQSAEGQRLTREFPTANSAPLVLHVGSRGPLAALRYRTPECRGRPVLRVAEGALVGAAAGWLGYELAIGIWLSGEGAKPGATVRRLRTAMILAGATFGAVRAAQCKSALPGA